MASPKLYKVWDGDNGTKKMVAASSMGELIEKGLQKLQRSRNVLLNIELEDGTEIDEDEIFSMLPSKEIIVFQFASDIIEPTKAKAPAMVPTKDPAITAPAKAPAIKVLTRQLTLTTTGKLGPELMMDTGSGQKESIHVCVDLKALKEASTIYKLKEGDKLAVYHSAINKASYELVQENPALVGDKMILLELARKKLDVEGYNYKKGRSRTMGQGKTPAKKRVCLSSQMRQEKLHQIREDINKLDLQHKLVETQREKYTTSQNYQGAIEASERLVKLRQEKQVKQTELGVLSKKDKMSEKRSTKRKNLLMMDAKSGQKESIHVCVDLKALKEASTIYKLKEGDKLAVYHSAINKASYELVQENPALVGDKMILLELARKKLDVEGYNYKKGRSRTMGQGQTPAKKRVWLSSQMRQEKLHQIREDINELDLQHRLVETQREKYTTSQNYQGVIEASERLVKLRQEKRVKQTELGVLSKKDKMSEKKRSTRRKNQRQKIASKMRGAPRSAPPTQSTTSDLERPESPSDDLPPAGSRSQKSFTIRNLWDIANSIAASSKPSSPLTENAAVGSLSPIYHTVSVTTTPLAPEDEEGDPNDDSDRISGSSDEDSIDDSGHIFSSSEEKDSTEVEPQIDTLYV